MTQSLHLRIRGCPAVARSPWCDGCVLVDARRVYQEYQSSQDLFVKKFEITEMPQYLLVHVSRFTKNTFFTEKNPTIVNFPVKCVRLQPSGLVSPLVDMACCVAIYAGLKGDAGHLTNRSLAPFL